MAGLRRFLSSILPQQNAPVMSQSELAEQGATAQEYEVLASNAEEETPTEPIGVPISALPGADTPTEDDIIPGVQDEETKRFSLSSLLAWIISQIAPADIGAVPDTRTVNSKALSSDITLDASDVGARPSNWTPSAADVGAQPTITASGILKGDGNGGVSAAVAGTDYATPAGIPSAYTSNPEMDGTASPGSSGAWAKGDHVHPSDTSKQDALTFDTAPTENSTNPVTSGGLYSSLVNARFAETTLFSTTTDVHSDTTVTMSEGRGSFKLFEFLFNSRSSSNAGYRMPLTISNIDLRQGGFYPLMNNEVSGYVRINIVSGQSAQVRIQDTNIATLYLVSITGMK